MDGDLDRPRRRRRSGFLLPGILLTVLTCLGVVALIASATGVLPDEVPILRAAGGGQRRAIVATAQPTPKRPSSPAKPSSAPAVTSGPTAAPTSEPTRGSGDTPTTDPTSGGNGGNGGGPTSGPTSKPTATPPAPKPPAPTCKAGSATVTAVADSYVDQNDPTTNYGGAGTNQVTSRDKGRNRRTLVRFALPAVPKGCTVTGGTLTLTAREATGRRIVATRLSRMWNEASVTWANMPGGTGSGVSATVSGRTVAWGLSAATVTGAAYGFVLTDASENAQGSGVQTGFGARTSAAGPTLTVRWA